MKRSAIFVAAALVAGAGAVAGVAHAQNSLEGDGFELAPGYIGPDGFFEPDEREIISGYGLVDGDLPDAITVDQGDGALTEFAGQRRNFDPGVIGGVLGDVKNGILGRN